MKTQCATCGSPLLKGGGLDQLCGACLFEGGRRPPAADLPDRVEQEEVARLFPELEILEPLGMGGMGVVWRARQKRLDREVALKLLKPELAEEPGFAERFQREARALAKLSHANVVVVHDFGEVRGRYFLMMEFVKGVGLRDLIRDGRLTPLRVLEIIPEICAGLQYAHENGVIHRDIKPENILIDEQGHVRIADFGLAKMLGQEEAALTRTSQVMGTYEYMAPEQIHQPLGVDHRADVYSLGVVLYEMLTGDLPRGRFASPSEKVPVDERLDGVVAKALQEEREARYQSVGAVQEDVEQIARSSKMDQQREHAASMNVPRETPPLPGPARASLEVGESSFVKRGALGWVEQLGIKPSTLLWSCLLASYLVFFVILIGLRSQNRGRMELFGLAYPLAWMAMTLLRTRPKLLGSRPARSVAWILASILGLSSLMLTGGDFHRDSSEVETQIIITRYLACALLIGAHVFLERGLRKLDPLAGLLSLVFLLVAAIVFSATPYKTPSHGLGFFLGMPGILCGASVITWLPFLLLEEVGARQRQALLILIATGLIFAAFYFGPLL